MHYAEGITIALSGDGLARARRADPGGRALVPMLVECVHPQWPELDIEDVLQDERMPVMPNPRPFDGHVEQALRVSSTNLIHFQCNGYSVPTEYVMRLPAYNNGRFAYGSGWPM